MAKMRRLIIRTPNLVKVQRFYSVIGIDWFGGDEEKIGLSGLPVSVENTKGWSSGGIETGLPDLIGYLGDTEVEFMLNKTFDRDAIGRGVIMHIEVKDLSAVAKKLEEEGLFIEAPWLCSHPWIGLLDPDGRQIMLSS